MITLETTDDVIAFPAAALARIQELESDREIMIRTVEQYVTEHARLTDLYAQAAIAAQNADAKIREVISASYDIGRANGEAIRQLGVDRVEIKRLAARVVELEGRLREAAYLFPDGEIRRRLLQIAGEP